MLLRFHGLPRLLMSSRFKPRNKKSIFIFVSLGVIFFYAFTLSDSDQDNPEDPDDNLVMAGDYDSRGCPLLPVAFSGMTGRLGNIISTYANFIALEYRLGHKYHLPLYMNFDPVNLTKPWLATIFKNVSFPTAHWSNFSRVEISNYRDAGPGDVMLFNNSKTGGQFLDCDLNYSRVENVMPKFDELEQCLRGRSVTGGTEAKH